MSLDAVELHAFTVILGELAGGTYEWDNLRFRSPN